jgi:hypothetical protein
MKNDELKDEYSERDLKNGERGRYYDAYQQSHNEMRRTVEMMDRSIENLNKGVAGEPLDLSRFSEEEIL